jgi:hypothetical protein
MIWIRNTAKILYKHSLQKTLLVENFILTSAVNDFKKESVTGKPPTPKGTKYVIKENHLKITKYLQYKEMISKAFNFWNILGKEKRLFTQLESVNRRPEGAEG